MTAPSPHYELTFEPLAGPGVRFVFPCDARGHVDLDALDERARNDYLFARAMVGRSLAAPAVHPCDIA